MMGRRSDSAVLRPDLCVLGAGAAGLSVAAGAAQMGASVVLVESSAMGGDCLNVGCVPSKALLAAAAAAQGARRAADLGIRLPEPHVDWPAVMAHVRAVIAGIAPHDSVERFEALGVTVIRARGRFVDPRTIDAGGQRIRPRRVVVATGSRPAVPPIPGLESVPVLTNETVFDLAERPPALVILGGGPIGCELAQAFRRLGSRVTLIEASTLLNRDDPEAVDVVRRRLIAEGVDVREGWRAVAVGGEAGAIRLRLSPTDGAPDVGRERGEGAGEWQVEGTHLLVALGRQPVTDTWDPASAGVTVTAQGVVVDDGLRTSNRRVLAIGDVAAGQPRFTHVAGAHAASVLKRILFRWPARVSGLVLPHVTYTDPELGAVGLSEAAARARHGQAVEVLRWSLADTDRARTDHCTDGLVKLVVGRRGRVLGVAVAGAHAGELLPAGILAVQRQLPVSALATMVAPYPTLGEAVKRAAGQYYVRRLFTRRTRLLVRLLSLFG